jgi:hypothetical protein
VAYSKTSTLVELNEVVDTATITAKSTVGTFTLIAQFTGNTIYTNIKITNF